MKPPFCAAADPLEALVDMEGVLNEMPVDVLRIATEVLNREWSDELETEEYFERLAATREMRDVIVLRIDEVLDSVKRVEHALLGVATLLHRHRSEGTRHDLAHAIHAQVCDGAE